MKTSASAAARLFACIAFSATALHAGMWDPLPMTVHEWGVNTFDWDADQRLDQELPGFLYTDKKPGKVAAKPEQRVRDLPADGGERTKPILYFYPTTKHSFEKPPQVGVEMRFASGYANAWWPQVNRYRTEKQSLAAKVPDWDKWKTEVMAGYKKLILGNGRNAKAKQTWEREMAVYDKLGPDAQIAFLANRMRWSGHSDFPEDERMQLVWDRLTLHASVPEDQTLPGDELPDDHWAKVAREVDAAYVSNGEETERYVFYEGKTRERPAIALLPERSLPFWWNRREGDPKDIAVVNVGTHPIYDVIAVYRDSEKGIVWTSHVPMLPALENARHHVDQVPALRVPDFSDPAEGENVKLGNGEFDRRTRWKLIDNLTAGYHYDPAG